MADAKHSPAPWSIDLELLGEDLRGHVPISSSRHGSLAQVVWKMEDDEVSLECEANARLIAAAPELLAACRMAIVALKGREHDGFLRDAIAKATGSAS